MDFIIFISISALLILSIVLLLRYRMQKIQTGQDSISESAENNSLPSKHYNFIKWFFLLGGVLSILSGLIHTFGFFTDDFSNIKMWDAIFNSSVGVIYLICYWFFNRQQNLVVWIFIFSVLLSIGYAFAVGRGFNYFSAIFGAYIVYRLLQLKKTNELK